MKVAPDFFSFLFFAHHMSNDYARSTLPERKHLEHT